MVKNIGLVILITGYRLTVSLSSNRRQPLQPSLFAGAILLSICTDGIPGLFLRLKLGGIDKCLGGGGCHLSIVGFRGGV